ncbi:MAG TPA: hypothetical protein VJ728_08395 [Candidatus Binataceae bacterium]|nr:hypothetical protein [Candidatus Binataceae bacterium]
MNDDLLFNVLTPLGFSVRYTHEYWHFISTYKHPVLAGKENEIELVLRDPDHVRRSYKDMSVFLFIVSLHQDGSVRLRAA